MAITLVSSQPYKSGFIVNGNSSDLSNCETLKAAVSGQSHYLERLDISSGSAITVTVGAGETANNVTTVIAGPIHMAANSQHTIEFDRPVQLATNTALTVDASVAGDVTVIAQGFTE